MNRLMATLIAPLATPVALAAVFSLLSLWQVVTITDWTPRLAFYGWLMVAVFATPAAYVMMVVAVPLAARLERRGRGDLASVVNLGLLLGALPFVVFDAYIVLYEFVHNPVAAIPRLMGDLSTAAKWVALGATCGAATAWTYWRLTRHRA
jgi:hypothetical protein